MEREEKSEGQGGGLNLFLRNYDVAGAQMRIRMEREARQAREVFDALHVEALNEGYGMVEQDMAEILNGGEGLVHQDEMADNMQNAFAWEEIGVFEEYRNDEAEEQDAEDEDANGEVVTRDAAGPSRRRVAIVANFDHHDQSEIDPRNRLYDRNDRNVPEWFFTNNRRDVLSVLSSYKTNYTTRQRSLVGTPEELTNNSCKTRLSTNKHYPLVIFRNQVYKPHSETVDGQIIATCNIRHPQPGHANCPGSVLVNPHSGRVTLRQECIHESRRDFLSIELIVRELCIDFKNNYSMERLYDRGNDLAELFEVSTEMWSNEVTKRKIFGKLKLKTTNIFPPIFDWSGFPNTTCLLDTSANFQSQKPVTMMWVANSMKQYISSATIINLDGIFNHIPQGFKQIYCISSKDPFSNSQIPLFFALSDSKSEECYKEIFEVTRNMGLNPRLVYSDFEKAAINAAEDVWPLSSVWGCWRHYKVALLRKAKKLVPTNEWNDDWKRLLRCLYGLSFAPLSKVDVWYGVLKARTIHIHPKMKDFHEYLNATWHCRERAFQQHDYTNNASEHLFAKYQRLFDHTNYKILRTAIDRTTTWCENVHRDVRDRRTWLNRRRPSRIPLYCNPAFLRVVRSNYANFSSFNSSIFPYMNNPKMFH